MIFENRGKFQKWKMNKSTAKILNHLIPPLEYDFNFIRSQNSVIKIGKAAQIHLIFNHLN